MQDTNRKIVGGEGQEGWNLEREACGGNPKRSEEGGAGEGGIEEMISFRSHENACDH